MKMTRNLATVTALTLLLTGLLAAHDPKKPWKIPAEAKARKNLVQSTAESVKKGAKLFRLNCVVCHGDKGTGVGPWQDILRTHPSDFTDGKMMGEHTDGELFWMISKGRDEMPPFEVRFSERQLWHLVNFLRSLSKK